MASLRGVYWGVGLSLVLLLCSCSGKGGSQGEGTASSGKAELSVNARVLMGEAGMIDLDVRKEWKNQIESSWVGWEKKDPWKRFGRCVITGHVLVEDESEESRRLGVGYTADCRIANRRAQLATDTPGVMYLPYQRAKPFFDRAHKKAFQDLNLRAEVVLREDEGVLRGLTTGVLGEVSQSIAEVIRRKLRGATPILLERLQDPQPICLEAIGALGVLGGKAELPALAKLTGRREPEILQATLFAMDSIGGPESVRYLSTIAEGHASAGVRQLARDLADAQKDRR